MLKKDKFVEELIYHYHIDDNVIDEIFSDAFIYLEKSTLIAQTLLTTKNRIFFKTSNPSNNFGFSFIVEDKKHIKFHGYVLVENEYKLFQWKGITLK